MNKNNTLPDKGWLLAFHPDLLLCTTLKNHANGTVITPDVYDIYTLSNQTTDVAVNVTGISLSLIHISCG